MDARQIGCWVEAKAGSEDFMINYESYLRVADDDSFIDMPFSSQALYFHILYRADDIGVLNNVHSIIRGIKADESDLFILLDKKLIFYDEDGFYRIRPWR